MKTDFGEKLAKLLEERGFSDAYVMGYTGMDTRKMKRMKNGKNYTPNTLTDLAEMFGLMMKEFIGDVEGLERLPEGFV